MSESTESISISNGSAVGQYLAGFSVSDINEDDSMSFIVNETESNNATNIQLGCTIIDANNELVPAIVNIAGSTPGEVIDTNDIPKSTENSDSQMCDTTNNISERSESEISRVEERTNEMAVDETHLAVSSALRSK